MGTMTDDWRPHPQDDLKTAVAKAMRTQATYETNRLADPATGIYHRQQAERMRERISPDDPRLAAFADRRYLDGSVEVTEDGFNLHEWMRDTAERGLSLEDWLTELADTIGALPPLTDKQQNDHIRTLAEIAMEDELGMPSEDDTEHGNGQEG
jgi:hypothetical protein